MEPPPPQQCLLPILTLFILCTTITSTLSPPPPPTTTKAIHSTSSPLDPKQLTALHSLNIPTTTDPCTTTTTTCDNSTPFHHLLSLHLSNCSHHLQISTTALKSLSSLTSLSLLNCPTLPLPHFPSQLSTNLHSFTAINSINKLTGVFLSHLTNLTSLTIYNTPIKASGPSIFLNPMKSLQYLTISQAKLTGFLPKHWHINLTHIDLSYNSLSGKIPTSLTQLPNLQTLNLSSNGITGTIPSAIKDLLALQNLSLSSNSLSGPIPQTLSTMPELVHLDLGSNQLNGTVPKFISDMKNLKFLNLENNKFHGVMPFNDSSIKRFVVFKIGGNNNLCYNQTTISSKLMLGIAPCNKYGLPIPPPPARGLDGSTTRKSSEDNDDDDGDVKSDPDMNDHKGPSKVVLGVAIGLSSIVFLIVFLVLLSTRLLNLAEVADGSSTLASQGAHCAISKLSLRRFVGDKSRHDSQRTASSGRFRKRDDEKITESSESNSANQDEIISLFRRIQSSISKEKSTTRKEIPKSSKENTSAESVLEVMRQSRKQMKANTLNERGEKVLSIRRGQWKNDNMTDDHPAVPDFNLTRPPSNFVKRSPIPAAPSSWPKSEDDIESLASSTGNAL